MKKTLVILILFLSLANYGQEIRLQNIWVLDKILKENGEQVGINNEEYYSPEEILEIIPNFIYINGLKTAAKFTNNKVETKFKKNRYKFEGNYLITKDNIKGYEYYFLEINNFIKNNPDFNPQLITKEKLSYVVSNQLIKPIFNDSISFKDFITKNISFDLLDDYKEVAYFKVNYLLTKENKINNIEIIDFSGIEKDKIKNLLMKTQPYLINPINNNLFVTFEYNFLGLKIAIPRTTSEERIQNSLNKLVEYYKKNKFEKVLLEYSKLNNKEIPNKFEQAIYEAKLKVAISYLALNKTNEACQYFENLGGNKNLRTRNYMINFCNKNK